MGGGVKSALKIPAYDRVVRALGDEAWDIELEADLPEGLADTPEHRKLAARVRRYKADFPAFCEEVLKIRTKTGKLVPFKLKKAQRHVWRNHIQPAFIDNRPCKLYLLKGRQIGFSTLTQGIQYWRMSLWPFLGGLTAAHSAASAAHIYGMQRLFYRNAPADFRPLQKNANRHELYFAHGKDDGEGGLESRIVVATANDEDLGASYTLQMVHLSEFARYDQRSKDVDQIIVTMLQAVPDEMFSLVVAETTGEGDNQAADFWRREVFTNVFIPWVADERYTKHTPIEVDEWSVDPMSEWGDEFAAANYIREHIRNWWADKYTTDEEVEHEVGCRLHWRRLALKEKCGGKLHLFQRQYPLTPDEAFSGGGKSVFDGRRLQIRQSALRDQRDRTAWLPDLHDWAPNASQHDERFVRSDIGDLIVYEPYDFNHNYVIGVDVAIGHEDGDYSVAQVFKVGQGAQLGQLFQAATFRAHIPPIQFADLIFDLGFYYGGAFLVPESNNAGGAVLERLKERGYNHMFVRQAQDTMTKKYIDKWGFHTSPHTKNLLISAMQEAILRDRILFNDEETLREMLAYTVDDRGRLSAPKGKHDDLVIAACLAVFGAAEVAAKRVQSEPMSADELEFLAFLNGTETKNSRGYTYKPTVM